MDESDTRQVIVKKLSLVVEGREDVSMDLTEDLDKIKAKKFVLKVRFEDLSLQITLVPILLVNRT